MEMVKAVNLKKYYITDTYEVHALDGVSLSAQDGEFLAIVGTSGSGKTTLLNLLGGLDVPTSGGVWIRGNSLKDMDKEERTIFRRRNIGFVFQQYNLVPVLSVYENIVLPLRLDGAEIDGEFLEEIVSLLGLDDKLERLPESRRNELVERLSRCYEDDSAVEYLRSTVEAEGGLTYAGEVMQDYIARAAAMLSDYGDSEYRSALVNLCAYIAERDR